MTWIKKNDDDSSNSFNFVAPEGAAEQVNEVLFPFAEIQEPVYAASVTVEVKQMETFVDPAELTGDLAMVLTIDAQVTKGAKLYVKLTADATNRTFAPGDGFDAATPDVTVTATTTVFKTYVYDGTAFRPV